MTHSKRKRAIRARQAKAGGGYQANQETELRARRNAWEARQPASTKAAISAPAAEAAGGSGGSPPAPITHPALPNGDDFRSRIQRVITLAREEAAESRQRDDQFGDALSAESIDAVKNGPTPIHKALSDEIETFEDDDTRKLISLMYAGRERVSLRTMHRELRFDLSEHARSQVLSKRGDALPTYLARALSEAEATAFDLDDPLPDRDLLQELSTAGMSDEALDLWDPEFLGLHRITHGTSADPEIASRMARENAAKGNFALDLGHEAKEIPRAAGERLEAFLLEKKIPFSRTSLSRTYIAKRWRPRRPVRNTSKVYSREDVRRCGAVAPDLHDWAASKVHTEEAHISYEHIDTRTDQSVPVVAREFVTAVGITFEGKPAWRFAGRIDALWGGPEPTSFDEVARWLRSDLDADRVIVHSFAGNIAQIDAIWFAKDSGFDHDAAEKLLLEPGKQASAPERTKPVSAVLRQQLGMLRQDAIDARLNIQRGVDVAAGFDANVVQLFQAIESLGYDAGKRSGDYARSIVANAKEPWDLGSVDRVIDRIDELLQEVAGSAPL